MARTTTKAPAPKAKLANPRNEALERMGKTELLKTVKTLDLRVTKLLNQLARKSDLVATDNIVWLCNGAVAGMMVLCSKDEPGAIGFVPLSPQQYGAARTSFDAPPDTRLPLVSPVAINETDLHQAAERGGKFPWEH